MKRSHSIAFLLLLVVFVFVASGCDEAEDAAEDAASEALGFKVDIKCDEDFPDVKAPKGWTCSVGFDLPEDKAKELDGEFEIDLSPIKNLYEFEDPDFMIAFAKAAEVEGEWRLEFANKIKVDDNKIILDGAALKKLGPSVGSSGAGWYGMYFADKECGFIHGVVADCDGNKREGILVLASDGPFFNYTADDGSWAIPSLSNKPANINFQDGEDCSGDTADPVTDEENPKDNTDEGDTPPQDPFDDGTDNVDSGEDQMGENDDTASSEAAYDFEDGTLQGFQCFDHCSGVSDAEYGDLFPDGDETQYLYLTSGGINSQNPSCTCTATMTVPDGMSELVISYDFMSQEWEEWAFTAYNDIFTAIIQGEFDYVINRTVDNTATDDDWADVSMVVAGVDTSPDAQYNATGAVFDGHLKWGTSENNTPRGGVEESMVGTTATFPVEAGATITLILTVSDVGDKIYDSAATIDWVGFK
jgi:hypothetical protein